MRRKNKLFVWIVLVVGFMVCLNSCLNGYTEEQGRETKIAINQVGYLPKWPKSAFLLNAIATPTPSVELVNAETQKSVLTIETASQLKDKASGDTIHPIDFTSFQQSGRYYLKAGDIQSYPFEIGTDIYQKPFSKLLRSYYLQRCGVELKDPETGISHPPCHLDDGIVAHDDAFHRAGDKLASPGGWHDAGDYGKYVSTTAVTAGRLLSLFEQYPKLFTDGQLAIPESGNGIPDILDEVKVGLEWMLTMQRQDGAVYRKLSGKQWPPLVPPQEDKQPRFVYGISTPETAKFAGALAMAARIYPPYDAEFARKCLKKAEKAWEFLQSQPGMKVDWVEGDDSGSGKYLSSEIDVEESLKVDTDDRLWAAAELFITTGKSSFEEYLANLGNSLQAGIGEKVRPMAYTLFEWKDPSALGMVDYLLLSSQSGAGDLKNKIKQLLIQRADVLREKVASSGYRLANDLFIWGSNKMAAEEGISLFYAYRLTGDRAYLQGAIDQLDYLLGRNHFNQSFVTDIGTQPVRHVHHIFARAQKIDIPGLLVGGPNDGAQDKIAPAGRGILSYLDAEGSYATNEYAIDYNASLIGLMGMLMNEF